ncbi:MAG: hypothetical protein KJI71_01630 [Patescibacteria group bacterium]|nr:hypothetical protein [Patescibacteria group bacterium]
MTKKEEMIRLVLNPDNDQPIYDFFIEIKKALGLKVNTEVARYCIKKAHELMFENKKED